MYWLVLGVGVLLLMMAGISLLAKGARPTARVAAPERIRLVPFMALAGVGCLLESVPHLAAMPFTATVVAGIVGALLLLAGSATLAGLLAERRRDRAR